MDIHYFRTIDGERQPFCLRLDDERNFLSDSQSEAPPAISPRVNQAHLLKMQAQGVQYEVNPNGGVTITHVPQAVSRRMRFFQPGYVCDFPGCEDVRRRYLLDREALGEDCTDCAEGSLTRKYLEELELLLP